MANTTPPQPDPFTELRAAATELRLDAHYENPDNPAFLRAIADLLDHTARNQVAFTPNVRPLILAVARAYLGGDA